MGRIRSLIQTMQTIDLIIIAVVVLLVIGVWLAMWPKDF